MSWSWRNEYRWKEWCWIGTTEWLPHMKLSDARDTVAQLSAVAGSKGVRIVGGVGNVACWALTNELSCLGRHKWARISLAVYKYDLSAHIYVTIRHPSASIAMCKPNSGTNL